MKKNTAAKKQPRKTRQAELYEREKMYQDLFENAEAGIYRTKLDGSGFLQINRKFAEILGFSRKELLGSASVMRWADPKDRARMLALAAKRGVLTDYEIRLLTKKGKVKTVRASVRLYRNKGYLQGSIVDVSDRKQAEEALKADKAQDEAILASIGDGLVVTDMQGRISMVNQVFTKLLGWAAWEVVGKKLVDVVPMYDKQKKLVPIGERLIVKSLQMNTLTKTVETQTLFYQRRDKMLFPVSVTVSPIPGKKGAVGAVEVFRDVTRQKRLEQESREQLQDIRMFRLAVESASDHIVITDNNGVIVYANRAVEQITGFSQLEVLGKKVGSKDLWGGQMEKAFYQKLWQTVKLEKKPFLGEIRNRRKDGREYYALTSISPVANDAGEVEFFVAIERDITKEKEIDKAKTEFVSLASHQLRTPTTTVNWFAKMLLNEEVGKLNGQQRVYLENIFNSNKRMINLVGDLLNVSHLELGTFSIRPEMADLSKIADEVLEELSPQLQAKKIDLIKRYQPGLPKLSVDLRLMFMILENLLSNAIAYTPAQGEVSLTIGLQKNSPQAFLISVADTGIGIPTAQQHRIFSKLFRADNAQKAVAEGTGLGLYIAKSILDQSGGKVWFESPPRPHSLVYGGRPGQGTTFFVAIPLQGMQAQSSVKTLK